MSLLNVKLPPKAPAISCPLCRQAEQTVDARWGHYRIVHCRICDLAFAIPRSIPDDLYDVSYESDGAYQVFYERAERAAAGKPFVEWAKRVFIKQATPQGRLLDVGCSTGVFLKAAQMKGWQVQGVEPSPVACEIARQVTGADIQVGTIENVPNTQSFDAVTAWEVLEHLADPVDFVCRVHQLLAPGGVIGLSVPNWQSPWERSANEPMSRPPYHLTYWSVASLTRLLETNGFQQVTVRQKPFAWGDEVGAIKWVYLPVSLARRVLFNHHGRRLSAIAYKEG